MPSQSKFQSKEVFIIVKGRAKITINKEEAALEAGGTVVIPARSIHRMENIESADVEYIALGISRGRGGRTVVAGDIQRKLS